MRTEVRGQRSEVSARRVAAVVSVAAVVRRRLTFPWCLGPHSISRALTSAATLLALGIALTAADARAQNFSIDWFTVDAGGGASTGGVYSVSGTIGQPDAGRMSGGQFTLQGGFWGLVAVQTPGAPTLRIYHTNGVVTVAWARTAEGWLLERINALPSLPAPWPQIPPPYQTNSADCFITTHALTGNAFFRLHKP